MTCREQNVLLQFENKLTWIWTELDNFELNYTAQGATFSPVYDSFYYHPTCFFDTISFVVSLCVYSLVTFNLEIYEKVVLFIPILLLYTSTPILKSIVHIYLDYSYFGMNTAVTEKEFFEKYDSEINYLNAPFSDGLTMKF